MSAAHAIASASHLLLPRSKATAHQHSHTCRVILRLSASTQVKTTAVPYRLKVGIQYGHHKQKRYQSHL